jgi:hypothetical protein
MDVETRDGRRRGRPIPLKGWLHAPPALASALAAINCRRFIDPPIPGAELKAVKCAIQSSGFWRARKKSWGALLIIG